MQPVTARFLDALPKSQKRITKVTVTPPGGAPQTLMFKSGSVSMDETSRTRRRGSLVVFGYDADYDTLSTPGALVRVTHGLNYGGGVAELVPVFAGEVDSGSQAFGGGAGEISVPIVDLSVWIQRSTFLAPYAPTPGTTRPQAIAQIVGGARPGTTILNTSTDTGTIIAGSIWTGSRQDAITGLETDGGTESFFLPDGTYLIRDQAPVSAPAVWTARGVLIDGSRTRPSDKLYNTVIVKPSATDGSQTWAQQIVQVTDPNHPRYPGKIGVVPYELASPTALTAAAAYNAGVVRLNRILGLSESLSLSMISNPALEGGDPIRFVIPALGNAPADIFGHILDSFSLDLVTGSMSAATRNQAVDQS